MQFNVILLVIFIKFDNILLMFNNNKMEQIQKSRKTNRNQFVRNYSLQQYPRVNESIQKVNTDDAGGIKNESCRYKNINNMCENNSTENIILETKWTQSKRLKTTALDCIIEKILKNHQTCELMVVITPSNQNGDQYKLHLIDRNSEKHLGMININQEELNGLGKTKVLDNHAIVFGSQYIDLNSIVSKAKTINATLSKNLKNEDNISIISTTTFSRCTNCLEPSEKGYSANNSSLKSFQTNPKKIYNNNKSSMNEIDNGRVVTINNENQFPVLNKKKDVEICRNLYINNQRIRANRGSQTEQILMCSCNKEYILAPSKLATLAEIMSLIKKIQKSAKPLKSDIKQLFDIAELCKFKLTIRPNLFFNKAAIYCKDGQLLNQILFYLECYLNNKNYIGYINLDLEALNENLDSHPKLLQNIKLAKDVFEVLPVPQFLVSSFYWFCSFFGIEILYDIVGETIYTCYKNYRSV